MEQTFGRGHGHQRSDLRAAAGLAKDHHLVRIAAKLADVVAHPLQRQHQVKLPGVTRVGELRSAETGEIEIAKSIQTMVDAYDHHVASAAQTNTIVERTRARTIRVCAAMDVEHHRALATVA